MKRALINEVPGSEGVQKNKIKRETVRWYKKNGLAVIGGGGGRVNVKNERARCDGGGGGDGDHAR